MAPVLARRCNAGRERVGVQSVGRMFLRADHSRAVRCRLEMGIDDAPLCGGRRAATGVGRETHGAARTARS